jgi:NAD(P)-dependent dehydrogenase (short-subunit alcohol dehydrogenase family)
MSNLYKDMFDLKTVAVIGGAGLLGSAIVKELAACNASPLIVDVDSKNGELLKNKIIEQGGNVNFYEADFSIAKNIPKIISDVEGRFGDIAGWALASYPKTEDWGNKLELVKAESWNLNVEMQMSATCLCAAEIAKKLASRGGGSIVTIGSIYGMAAPNFDIYENTDMTTPAAYAAIKGGISAFTRYLSSYYGSKNVRVNSIAAGGILNNQPNDFIEKYSSLTSLGRLAKPEEIASAAIYLLSDNASYITGIDLPVDGGYLSR